VLLAGALIRGAVTPPKSRATVLCASFTWLNGPVRPPYQGSVTGITLLLLVLPLVTPPPPPAAAGAARASGRVMFFKSMMKGGQDCGGRMWGQRSVAAGVEGRDVRAVFGACHNACRIAWAQHGHDKRSSW
jgi:hypothetical protein